MPLARSGSWMQHRVVCTTGRPAVPVPWVLPHDRRPLQEAFREPWGLHCTWSAVSQNPDVGSGDLFALIIVSKRGTTLGILILLRLPFWSGSFKASSCQMGVDDTTFLARTQCIGVLVVSLS